MRQQKRLLLILLVLVCLFTEMVPLTGFAADRQYLVRFSGGNKGTISGQSVFDNVTVNDIVPFPTVVVESGYYQKGFVESGKDPLSYESPSGYVNMSDKQRDLDYVAVYGIKGTEVKYTVQYLENGTTTKLAKDGTFYAAVGDKPVSSYIYIEGYQPYRRTTKTIVADESQNILYCYYTKIQTGGGGGGGGQQQGGGGGGAAAAGAANAGGNQNQNQNNPNVNAAGNTTVNPAAPQPSEQPQYQQTEDILDLDVPLAEPGGAPAAPAIAAAPQTVEPAARTELPTWALGLGAGVLVCLIALLYWYLLFYRKKKKYAGSGLD